MSLASIYPVELSAEERTASGKEELKQDAQVKSQAVIPINVHARTEPAELQGEDDAPFAEGEPCPSDSGVVWKVHG